MPLYELEEGTSRKFYRVDVDGKRVHLHWGRIGSAGTKRTLAFDSAIEARAEYERQIAKRREHGYRLVVDESVPHSKDEQRQVELSRGAPLAANPRFMFVRGKRVVWIEAAGQVLLRMEAEEASPTAAVRTETPFASAREALAARDRAMAELTAAGYKLRDFDAKRRPAKRAAGPEPLAREPALEAMVVEAPYDEARWMVLEDWVLQQGDIRAHIASAMREGRRDNEAALRRQASPALLGPASGRLAGAISSADWRAGYVRACAFDLPDRDATGLFAAFCAAPALRLLRALELRFETAPATVLAKLASAGFADVLDGLALAYVPAYRITTADPGEHVVDVDVLASLPRLATLAVVHAPLRLRHLDRLAHLRSLVLTVDDTRIPEATLPRLASLELRPHGTPDYARAIEALELPALATLRAHVDAAAVEPLLAALASRSLARTVTTLSLGGRRTDPAPLRGRFPQLTTLELPDAR